MKHDEIIINSKQIQLYSSYDGPTNQYSIFTLKGVGDLKMGTWESAIFDLFHHLEKVIFVFSSLLWITFKILKTNARKRFNSDFFKI